MTEVMLFLVFRGSFHLPESPALWRAAIGWLKLECIRMAKQLSGRSTFHACAVPNLCEME